jgi:hypothetical protein
MDYVYQIQRERRKGREPKGVQLLNQRTKGGGKKGREVVDEGLMYERRPVSKKKRKGPGEKAGA